MSSRSNSLKNTLSRLDKKDASLRIINLYAKRIGDAGIVKLADALLRFDANQIKYLSLCGNYISDVGATKLANLLRMQHSVLERLDLGNNNIGDTGAQEIAQALSQNSMLQALYLCGNSIRGKGAQAFAHALVGNATLNRLYLSRNDIGKKAGQTILESLDYNSTIVEIRYTRHISDEKVHEKIQAITTDNEKEKRNDIVQKRKVMYVFPFILSNLFANTLPNELNIRIWEYCFGEDTKPRKSKHCFWKKKYIENNDYIHPRKRIKRLL